LSLPVFSADAAFPYTIRAVTSPDGEAVRKIVQALQKEGFEVFASTESREKGVAHRILVGRFKSPEEAQAAVERVKRVGGFQGAEVIQAAPLPSPRES
jgi:cell division septation protein DedD